MSDAGRDSSIPWSMVTAVIGMMFILASAVVLPSYWEYKLRQQQLERLSSAQQTSATPAQTVSAGNQPASTNPSPTVPQALNIVTNQTQGVPSQTSNPLAVSAAFADYSGKVYEAYGRLITLLVGLISVMGIFFGYFLKSDGGSCLKSQKSPINKSCSRFLTTK